MCIYGLIESFSKVSLVKEKSQSADSAKATKIVEKIFNSMKSLEFTTSVLIVFIH